MNDHFARQGWVVVRNVIGADELAPGDISIHHCLTLHGSAPNHSGRARRTIILRMFDGDCTLDRSRLPPGAEQYFPTENDRLLPSAFPIVFERDT